jgi:hypothetical protein
VKFILSDPRPTGKLGVRGPVGNDAVAENRCPLHTVNRLNVEVLFFWQEIFESDSKSMIQHSAAPTLAACSGIE